MFLQKISTVVLWLSTLITIVQIAAFQWTWTLTISNASSSVSTISSIIPSIIVTRIIAGSWSCIGDVKGSFIFLRFYYLCWVIIRSGSKLLFWGGQTIFAHSDILAQGLSGSFSDFGALWMQFVRLINSCFLPQGGHGSLWSPS